MENDVRQDDDLREQLQELASAFGEVKDEHKAMDKLVRGFIDKDGVFHPGLASKFVDAADDIKTMKSQVESFVSFARTAMTWTIRGAFTLATVAIGAFLTLSIFIMTHFSQIVAGISAATKVGQ